MAALRAGINHSMRSINDILHREIAGVKIGREPESLCDDFAFAGI
jgi:hypothetical protein